MKLTRIFKNRLKIRWRVNFLEYSIQFALPSNEMLTLCQLANELGKALMHANKPSTPNQRGRPSTTKH